MQSGNISHVFLHSQKLVIVLNCKLLVVTVFPQIKLIFQMHEVSLMVRLHLPRQITGHLPFIPGFGFKRFQIAYKEKERKNAKVNKYVGNLCL